MAKDSKKTKDIKDISKINKPNKPNKDTSKSSAKKQDSGKKKRSAAAASNPKGRKSDGGKSNTAKGSGSRKPIKKSAELQIAELKKAGYEEIGEEFPLNDYEDEAIGTEASAKVRAFLKSRQSMINELSDTINREKRERIEKTETALRNFRLKAEEKAKDGQPGKKRGDGQDGQKNQDAQGAKNNKNGKGSQDAKSAKNDKANKGQDAKTAKSDKANKGQNAKNTRGDKSGKAGKKAKSAKSDNVGKGGQDAKKDRNAKGGLSSLLPFANKKGSAGKNESGIGSGRVKIIFLGGLEQIGMNITAFESDDSLIAVDCGMAFPDQTMPGIDLVIPDITYLEQNMEKIKGIFITHGHEDHIGALPYVLRKLNVPVYCTRLTRGLIEHKLEEVGLLETVRLETAQFGDVIEAGSFAVEFIKTNHSIQDAAALALHTPAGVILHTGDFKVDYTPVYGDPIDLQRFAELGKQGVLALLCDSTNAGRLGFTMSERSVGHTFELIFSEYRDNRIVVATFASNVDRVQQIINVAEKYGRKVVIDGRSMVNVIGIANELGYIKMNSGTLIDISEMKNYPSEKVVLIVTGSQGEPMAALSRMAQGQHKKVYLGENDVIVLSSTPIPGNEKAVSKVINELSRKHTKVIYQDTHVSGHACAEDIKLIYSLVHPRYAIPIHGEYRHRLSQRELALQVGVPSDNIIMADTGDVLEICSDYCVPVDRVQAGPVLVDGLGVGDVGNIVLRDRQNLAQNGIIIATITLERSTGQVIAGPDIVTRGFVYVRENEDLIEEARNVVLDALDDCSLSGNDDWAHIKNVIRDELNEFIWRRMKRTPMILPIISEV